MKVTSEKSNTRNKKSNAANAITNFIPNTPAVRKAPVIHIRPIIGKITCAGVRAAIAKTRRAKKANQHVAQVGDHHRCEHRVHQPPLLRHQVGARRDPVNHKGTENQCGRHLDPLPPIETGAKVLAYMGGIDAAVTKARVDFEAGEYRWVAQVMNHAVFVDPTHDGARQLLADTYEQLAYLAESSTWRNSYLFGAHELRHGTFQTSSQQYDRPETIASLTHAQMFDFFGTRIDPAVAESAHLTLRIVFNDSNERHLLTLRNCTLTHVQERQEVNIDATARTTRSGLDRLLLQRSSRQELVDAGELHISGDASAIDTLLACLAPAPGDFNIVEP